MRRTGSKADRELCGQEVKHPPSPGKSSGRAGHREEGGEAGAARGPEGSLGGRHAAAAGDW